MDWIRLLVLPALAALVAPASAQVDYRLTATPEQTQAEPGEAFNIDWRLRNVGSLDGPDTEIRFVLSTDATVSGDDALLSTEEVDGVEAGEEEDGTEGVNAPDWAPGYYYLLVAEGADGDVVVFSFVLGSPGPSPDLAVESVTTDDADGVVEVGQTVTVSAVIANDGDGASPQTTVGLYLSDDDEVSTDDQRVGETTLGSLAAGASTTAEVSFTVPNDPDGEFVVLVRADDLDEVNELSETNNVGARSLVTPAADIVLFSGLYVETFDSMGTAAVAPLPTGWTASGTGIADGTTTTAARGGNGYDFGQSGLVNFGSGPAATAGDRALGFDFAAGAATLTFRNDTGGPISQFELGYVWEIYGAGADENHYTGTDASYSYDGETWVGLDLFQFVSTGDNEAGYADAPSRYAVNKTRVVNLASPIAEGARFYVRFEEDGFDDEGEEPGDPNSPVLGLDNVFLSTTPGVPLVFRDHAERDFYDVPVGGVSLADEVGGRFPLREGEPRPDVQAVLGGANPGDFTVELDDDGTSWDDLTVYDVRFTPTAEGDREATLTFVIDGDESEPVALRGFAEAAPPGFPTGPGPDYVFTESGPDPSPFPAGQGAVGMNYVISNYGQETVEAEDFPRVGLYLSTDETLSEDDRTIAAYDDDIGRLTPLGETSSSAGGFLPLDAAPGDYFVLAHIDDLEIVEENLEDNNVAAYPITVTDDGGPTDPTGGGTGTQADLRVSRIEIDGDVNAAAPFPEAEGGDTVSLRVLVGNVGGADAPATELRIGMTESYIEALCLGELTRVPIGPLAVGEVRFETVELEIPEATDTGRYILCAQTDPDDEVPEQGAGGIARAALDVVSLGLPPLAGSYAVPDDYDSLADALDALKQWGMAGPVRIELAPGTYADRVRVENIPGLSAENRLTITSASGDPSDTVVSPPASTISGSNYIVQLDGGHTTVSNLTFRPQGTDYQSSLRTIYSDGDDLDVLGNVFEGNGPGSDQTSQYQQAVYLRGNGVRVIGNAFTGTPTAISVSGDDPEGAGTEVRDNTVAGATGHGIAIGGAAPFEVTGNTVESGYSGISASFAASGGRIDGNRVQTEDYGIRVVNSGLGSGAEGVVSNNMVTVMGSANAGLFLDYADGWQALHNSVVVDGGAAFVVGDGPGTRVVGNVFVNTGDGLAYHASYAIAPFESSHNALWAPNGSVGRVGQYTYDDLGAFVDALDDFNTGGAPATGFLETDPAFADPARGDLHTAAEALQAAGTDVGLAADFDGEPRPQPAGSAPDLGADETGDVSGPVSIVIDGRRGSRFLGVPSPGVTVDDLAAQNLVRGVPGYYPAAEPANLWTRYDAEAASWTVSAGTGEVLEPGHSFRWFFYDRDVGNPDVSRSRSFPATLATDLPPNEDDVEVELQTGGSRFNYLANPFGQPLDLNGLFSWPGGDNLAVPYGVEVYDDQARTWEPAPAVLQPWEGFRVRAKGPRLNGAPRRLTIPASAVASAAPRSADRGAEADGADLARLAFSLDGADADGGALADRSFAVVFADDASPTLDAADAPREAVGSEAYAALAARVGDAVVSRDVRPFTPGEVALAVGARGARAAFTLSWDASALPDGLPVVLVDRATGAEVDVRTRSAITVTVPEQPALSEAEAMGGAAVDVEDRLVLRIGSGSAEASVAELALSAPAPNPTSGPAQIAFAVPEAGPVRLAVYDVRGRRVVVLEDRDLAAGRYEAALDGSSLAAGVYVVRLEAGGEVVTRRAAVVR